jgi:FAD/FMN-containing dehydrogenase
VSRETLAPSRSRSAFGTTQRSPCTAGRTTERTAAAFQCRSRIGKLIRGRPGACRCWFPAEGANALIASQTLNAADWNALQAAIAGEVILPDSPAYDEVRKPFFARFHDVRPQAVVLCRTPSDVAETMTLASRSGLQTATRSGGHCFAGRSSSHGIVIDVTPMRSVSLSGGVARVGAGARLGQVYESLQQHDLMIPAGSCPSVGIAGLTLGGGLGIFGRTYGLTSDHVLGAQIVLADGRVVECDDHHDEDLFWALRGAGAGNFGVVTSFVFRTSPAPSATNLHLAWPFASGAAVIDAWQSWAPAAPDELAASLLLRAAAEAEQPPTVDLFATMLGSEQDAAELLDELIARATVEPESDFRKHMSFAETRAYWAEPGAADEVDEKSHLPPLPQAYPYFKSEFFRRPLPTDAIAALLANFAEGRVSGQSRELDFTPWAGAYNRVPDDATAFVHRHELFSLKHAVIVSPEASSADKEAARLWVTRSWASVRQWGSGRVFPNFPDPDLPDSGPAYYGTNYERLRSVKRRYDPGNFFRFHQSLQGQQ